LSSVSPMSVSAYGGAPVSFFISLIPFVSFASDWICSFSFGNVTAVSVTRTGASSATVICIPPSNFQALTNSVFERSCLLHYTGALFPFSLTFELEFTAPPKPFLSFVDNSHQLRSDSAAIIVRNFAPFASISLVSVSIRNYQVDIRSFILRSEGSLVLQFTINCASCGCCTEQAVVLTVSNSRFPMMTSSTSVVITDPNALVVTGVSPSVLPSSGGENVEIRVQNFPSESSIVSIRIDGANSVTAYQVDTDTSSSFSRVRFFSPPLIKGNPGYSIHVNGIEKVSVLSRSPLSFTVVDLVLSGFCTTSSISAFGNIKASCFVKHLPPSSSPGQVEFSYVWTNNTALVTSKDLECINMGASLFLVEMNLPNVANKIVEASHLKLQIANKNFPSLIFSFDIELLPSPPAIIFVDPASGPNSEPIKVTVYVEYFQGSLAAVEAKLNGAPIAPDSYIVERIDISTAVFYFLLPRALRAGSHSISFWSGDTQPLSFTFTALDALTPRLKYMLPSQGSTKGGDAVFIMVDNFDAQGDLTVTVGSAQAQLQFLECFSRSCTITAMLPVTSNAAVVNVTLSSSGFQFLLPQQFQYIRLSPVLTSVFLRSGSFPVALLSHATFLTCLIPPVCRVQM